MKTTIGLKVRVREKEEMILRIRQTLNYIFSSRFAIINEFRFTSTITYSRDQVNAAY